LPPRSARSAELVCSSREIKNLLSTVEINFLSSVESCWLRRELFIRKVYEMFPLPGTGAVVRDVVLISWTSSEQRGKTGENVVSGCERRERGKKLGQLLQLRDVYANYTCLCS
jgi:hypothetical protein